VIGSICMARFSVSASSLSKYEIIPADPATGILYRINGFLSGHIRLRGRGNGAYPFKYLEMIERVFGKDDNTLEVCSGTVKESLEVSTVDVNSDLQPTICCDAQDMSMIRDNSFTRWRCDPPYTPTAALRRYGSSMPALRRLLREGVRVVRPGSLLFLLCSQNYQWHPVYTKRVGMITISIVPNNELRACNIYKKLQ
jgi:hypothetical protein